jgi:hypothetical protein
MTVAHRITLLGISLRTAALAGACGLAMSACSAQPAASLPPLHDIEQATLAYANCVDQAARKLGVKPTGVEELARQAVGSCRELREAALKLKSVPVMFPSVAEFDAVHAGLARSTIEASR